MLLLSSFSDILGNEKNKLFNMILRPRPGIEMSILSGIIACLKCKIFVVFLIYETSVNIFPWNNQVSFSVFIL